VDTLKWVGDPHQIRSIGLPVLFGDDGQIKPAGEAPGRADQYQPSTPPRLVLDPESHHRHAATDGDHEVWPRRFQRIGPRGIDVMQGRRDSWFSDHISRSNRNALDQAGPWQN